VKEISEKNIVLKSVKSEFKFNILKVKIKVKLEFFETVHSLNKKLHSKGEREREKRERREREEEEGSAIF